MDNRTAFLNTIAQALGRPLRFEPQADAAPVNNYANERLTELSPQQRCDAFIQFASEVMLARCELTSEDQAADAALRLCEELGQQPVVLSGDSRLVELGITERLQQECNAVVWDPARGSENITQAEQAKVGVVYAEYGLTESGGVVLFSAPERGRSLSLLPESSIFVLRKAPFCRAWRSWQKNCIRKHRPVSVCHRALISSVDPARRRILNLSRWLGYMAR